MRNTIKYLALPALVLVLVLTACGTAATPTPAPVPTATQPPAAVATTAPTVAATAAPTATPSPFIFGLLLVGPHNDQGWSQATYEGAQYVEQNVPGAKMIYLENVYSGSPTYPGQTASQLATQLVAQGAKLIIFNSDDMKDEALKFAQANPNIYVIGV